ncbi:MAG: helix-turn-helix domain-containing protein, partial [Clostridiales bacterium]|nr:helix-turn-helix domain-containing protein [Clostridiales bacterium]
MNNEVVDLTLGEVIRNARKNKGLTQKELAQMIGAKDTSISNWEKNHNRPNGSTLIMLFRALDISVNDLLGDYNPDLNELDDLQHKNQIE